MRYVTEVSRWITAGGGPQGVAPWVDPVDGFDYHEAAEKLAAYVRAGSRGWDWGRRVRLKSSGMAGRPGVVLRRCSGSCAVSRPRGLSPARRTWRWATRSTRCGPYELITGA